MRKRMYFAQTLVSLLSLFFLIPLAWAEPMGMYAGAGTGVVVNTRDGGSSFRGVPLAFFVGYGGRTDPRFYFAGEVIGNVNTANIDNNGLKSTYSWGVSLIPGAMLSDQILAFVRIGGVRNHFNSGNKTGAVMGAGLQTRLTREWDVRGEYDYMTFSNSLKTDQFAVGLVYKFL